MYNNLYTLISILPNLLAFESSPNVIMCVCTQTYLLSLDLTRRIKGWGGLGEQEGVYEGYLPDLLKTP